MKNKSLFAKSVNILLAFFLTFSFALSSTSFGVFAESTNDVTLSFDWFKTSGLALIPNVNLSSLYGVSGSKDFTGLITVDGTEKTAVYTVTGINLVLWGVKTTNASSTIEIKAGTVLTCAGVNPIRITKAFILKKTNGIWAVEVNTNEVTVSFDWFSSSGLALLPSVNLSSLYGVTGSKDFTGLITVDGTEKTVVYSVTGINLVLWGVKTTNASATVEIKAGTVLTCAGADSIRITKTFRLKKTNGSWIVDLCAAVPEVSEPEAVSAVNGHSSQISVNASVSDGGTLSYQWYDSGVLVSGASEASLITTDFPSGIYYLTCTVTNTSQGLQASTTVSMILTVYDRGDITLSGNISVNDVILIRNHILGKEKLVGINQKAADMDIDGKITIVDMLLMKQTVLDTNYDFVSDGASSYFILLPSNPTVNEGFAASELQLLTKKATGAELKIVKEGSSHLIGKFISVGNTNVSKAIDLSLTYAELKNNGFIIETIGNACYIRGYSDIGTRNGVYEFLHYLFDYECYAADEIYLTLTKYVKLPDFSLSVTPDFDWREANYGEIIYNTDLCYRMRFNPTEEIYVMGHNTHNSMTIISPLVYDYTSLQYKSWFSQAQHANGKFSNAIVPAQLCYSNEEMTDQYILNLIERIETSSAKVMLMGMEDNTEWCTCEQCSASKAEYGTNSAVMIKFANKVQQGVNEWFQQNRPGAEPTKLVIFAYYETIDPPVTYNSALNEYVPIDDTVVLNNDVGIMFAPIEASYSVPFVDQRNAATHTQIEGWSSITNNLYAWTYSLLPSSAFVMLDTIEIMQQNYSFLIENNAKGILDQTEHYQRYINSGWSRVKAYVMSKLQWDNTLDSNALIENYFKFYFDKSSGVMKELFTDEHEWLTQHVYGVLGAEGYIWENLVSNNYWTYPQLTSYLNKINQAYASISSYQASNPEKYTKLYDRITIESMQFRYLMIQIYSANFSASELLNMKNSFKADFERLNFTTYAEGANISALWSSWGI